MEIYKIEITRKERIYVVGCFLAAILLFGTAGAMETDLVTFGQGVWQIAWAMILGLWCSNGIRLEECRAAHPRRW
jgi:hypothetical protein